MENFWVVTLFHWQPTPLEWAKLQAEAIENFEAMGIEEFSLDEPQVDELLGERSYSGGDLPQEVLDEVEERVLSKLTNYRLFFGEEKTAKAFLAFAQKEFLCESQLEACASEDWNAEWKKHYAPILVNDQLEIIPSWMKGEAESVAKKQIFIYPGMGFGTGSHETTFLCLKLFTEHLLKSKIEHVLDFGSGSGILGLATFNFFPEARVDFYDIDPEANKNCYQNAELNGFEGKSFRLLLPEVREKLSASYNLVFANILESILQLEKKALVNYTAPGGHLILSGLLLPQVDGIVKAYCAEGLELVKREDKKDWSALLFRRK